MFPCELVILLSILSSSAIMFVQLISDHLTKDVALSKHQLETRETSASERGPCTIYCHLEKYLQLFLLIVKFWSYLF